MSENVPVARGGFRVGDKKRTHDAEATGRDCMKNGTQQAAESRSEPNFLQRRFTRTKVIKDPLLERQSMWYDTVLHEEFECAVKFPQRGADRATEL